jgi:hypothetical protein
MTPKNRDWLVVALILAIAIALMIFSLLSEGCASPGVPRAKLIAGPDGLSDAACLELMDKRDGAELAGKILAGVGGVSALGTAPSQIPDGARWGIGAGAAASAAVSVAVLWYGERKSAEFERYCDPPDPDELTQTGRSSVDLEPSPFLGDGGVD